MTASKAGRTERRPDCNAWAVMHSHQVVCDRRKGHAGEHHQRAARDIYYCWTDQELETHYPRLNRIEIGSNVWAGGRRGTVVDIPGTPHGVVNVIFPGDVIVSAYTVDAVEPIR